MSEQFDSKCEHTEINRYHDRSYGDFWMCRECQTKFVPASRLDRYQEALASILTWANAYPLQVFPEPDFKKAHEVLTAAGLTLDAISGSNMRHALVGVGNIAREALK